MFKYRLSISCLMSSLVLAVAGCGGGDPAPAPRTQVEAPPVQEEQRSPDVAPLSLSDLPGEIVVGVEQFPMPRVNAELLEADANGASVFRFHAPRGAALIFDMRCRVEGVTGVQALLGQAVRIRVDDAQASMDHPDRMESDSHLYIPRQFTMQFIGMGEDGLHAVVGGTFHVFDKGTGERAAETMRITGNLYVQPLD